MAKDALLNDPAFAAASKATAALVALVGVGKGAEPEKIAEFLARGVLMAWAQNGGMSGASAETLKAVAERGLTGKGAERSH
ncbi:hypothetical protein ACIQW5_27090 [Methylorubrum thiocyanatum]|uniref:hypothetical protein n=1 Tax=Methylorubrum thiocyanatum TaxID=47958 RepID=UPI00383B39DB